MPPRIFQSTVFYVGTWWCPYLLMLFHDEDLFDISFASHAVGLLGKLVTESEGEVTLKVALICKRRVNEPMTSLPSGSVQTAGYVYGD